MDRFCGWCTGMPKDTIPEWSQRAMWAMNNIERIATNVPSARSASRGEGGGKGVGQDS